LTFSRIALALMLVMVAVLLAVGCAGQVGDGKSTDNVTVTTTVPTPIPSSTKISNYTSTGDLISALQSYRNNLTYPRNKIPEDLLKLTDSRYPKNWNTPEETRAFFISINQMIPAEQAITQLSINNTTSHPVGSQVYLIIHVNSSASTHIIDPAITSVIGRYEEYHTVAAWADINNLEKLAGIDGVESMKVNVPPEHS